MHYIIDRFLQIARNRYAKYTKKKVLIGRFSEDEAQKSANIIYDILTSDQPCMIARFGLVEISCLINYLGIQNKQKNPITYISGKTNAWWWTHKTRHEMINNAGFFPITPAALTRFCELLLQDMSQIDILASWRIEELILDSKMSPVSKIPIIHLEPYFAKSPWTRALEGKNILVIHPFVNQIKRQFQNNRLKLFKDSQILPKFNILTLRAIQSIGGETNGFDSWFDALDYMKAEMDKINYDICIIGCGAYGFHLAAHAKRKGKKAIHMGGATQLLFGIKGNRWENSQYGVSEWGLPEGFYSNIFNEYWIKPGNEGRPQKADQVEGACYW